MKIKVIDLLNKIANEEEVPKQIKASRMIWTYEKGFNQYRNSNFQELIKYLDGHYSNYATGLTFNAILNYEVEIIEEDKEIEKLDENNTNVMTNIIENRKKINELIDAVNELKKGK